MKVLVAYSSQTGNTKRVAEAIHSAMGDAAELAPISDNPDVADYDLVLVGFWVEAGMPDQAARAFLEGLRDKAVGLFATMGDYPDTDHAFAVMDKAQFFARKNRVLATFMCQGAVDGGYLAEVDALRETNPDEAAKLSRWVREGAATGHPNEEDLQRAREVFSKLLEA